MGTREDLLDAARPADVLTVRQFAALLQVHPATARRWIRAGRVPGVIRYGAEIRIVKRIALAVDRTRRHDPA